MQDNGDNAGNNNVKPRLVNSYVRHTADSWAQDLSGDAQSAKKILSLSLPLIVARKSTHNITTNNAPRSDVVI